jgi:O-antigen/teichoic acid export membrane protein
MMTMFSVAMSQSLIPAFSQLQGPDKLEQLSILYTRGIRIALIVVIPLLVMLVFIAKPFFEIWAGREYGDQSTIPFYLLAVGLGFNAIVHFPGALIIAAGRSDVFAKLYWIELFPYLIFAWLLIGKFGVNGAAAAWSIRIIADGFVNIIIAHRITHVRIDKNILRMFVLPIIVMAVPFAMIVFVQKTDIIVALITAICTLAYVFMVWRYLLRSDEIQWLSTNFSRLVRFRLQM